jgi:hypothetical protein
MNEALLISSDSPIAKHRFIFIGGLHRSGTTPLFNVLRDHPSVSGFHFSKGAEKEHEGQYHQTVYPNNDITGGPGYFCLHDEAFFTEKSDLVSIENAERLFAEWARHWDLSRPYLLEKSPPNLARTRFLQRLFPNSYFIIIMRHPIAVSLATIKWMGWPRHVLTPSETEEQPSYSVRASSRDDNRAFWQSPKLYTESMFYTLFEHWKRGHFRFLEDARRLDRSLAIRYEDFVEDPVGTMEHVCRFADLPSVDVTGSHAISNHNERYFEEWESMDTDVMSPRCRQFLMDEYSEAFNRFGYSLSEPRRILPFTLG